METWGELIADLADGRDIVLLATATTGLKPETSSLLALSWARYDSSKLLTATGSCQGTLFKMVPEDQVHAAEQYNRITVEKIAAEGLQEDDLLRELRECLSGTVCFSYNPWFHFRFLSTVMLDDTPYIHDLPLLLKGAESHMPIDDMSSLSKMEKALGKRYGRTPGLAQMCATRNIEAIAPQWVLPVEYNVDVLCRFWELLRKVVLPC